MAPHKSDIGRLDPHDQLLSIVVPAYNESRFIVRSLCETIDTLRAFGYRFEVVVVDDGSIDGTHIRAIEARNQYPDCIRVVRYANNLGKGQALITGARYARGEVVVFLDADMDLHPEQLPLYLGTLNTAPADVVIASKLHPLSRVDYPLARRILSRGYSALVKILFGLPLHDTQTGLKVFKAAVLKTVMPVLLVKRFAFDTELLVNVAHRGFKIVDAPVTLTTQRYHSRIHLGDAWKIFVDTLAIFYRLRIIHYYDRVEDEPALDSHPEALEIEMAESQAF